MPDPLVANVTALLHELQSGDGASMGRLLDVIYPELRHLARCQFQHERSGHVLQPTALVHEAYLRLVDQHDHCWQNRAHFFGAAAQIMRRILIDHARAQRADKRDRDCTIPLEDAVAQTQSSQTDVLALDEALVALERLSPRQARIVELRYFAGLSISDVAEALGLNARTVDRDWATARAWLRRRLCP